MRDAAWSCAITAWDEAARIQAEMAGLDEARGAVHAHGR